MAFSRYSLGCVLTLWNIFSINAAQHHQTECHCPLAFLPGDLFEVITADSAEVKTLDEVASLPKNVFVKSRLFGSTVGTGWVECRGLSEYQTRQLTELATARL